MTDISLILPGGVHGIFGVLGDTLVACEPPLWCRILAGYLRDRGHSVMIIDQDAERLTPAEVAKRAADTKIAALVVHGHQPSASTQAMVPARSIADAIQKRGSALPTVVFLGNHPSALPERTLREEPCHFVLDGEGAIGLEFMLNGAPRDEVPGLVWWHGNQIVRNALPPLLPMSELHGNVWDMLPMHRYRAHNWQCLDDPAARMPYASIHTTLGCSYACSFCMINSVFHTNRYRRRDPDDVVKEVVHLYNEYGVRTIKIIDELFVLHRGHVRAICQGIVDAGIGDELNIWAYSRSDSVHADDLSLIRAAGIRWLAIGIESGSAEVRAGANKALRGDDGENASIFKIVRAIQAAGISIIGNYIVGLPDDTLESMEETYQLAAALNTEFMNVYACQIYPGSQLYTDAIASGRELSTDWRTYSHHNRFCLPSGSKTVSPRDVLAFRDEFFQRYFTRPEYLKMIREKFGDVGVEQIRSMTAYNLERDLLGGVPAG